MTRKDFLLLSDALRLARADCAKVQSELTYLRGIDDAARAIGSAIARDHTGFNRTRFLLDAGVGS